MELLQLKCPTCQSVVLQYHTSYTTQHHGSRIIYKCASCPGYFSETKKTLMAGVKTPVSVIWQVVKARTEGMGLNAAARTFEKAKNTILAWERKAEPAKFEAESATSGIHKSVALDAP
jgi:transposase-like protein